MFVAFELPWIWLWNGKWVHIPDLRRIWCSACWSLVTFHFSEYQHVTVPLLCSAILYFFILILSSFQLCLLESLLMAATNMFTYNFRRLHKFLVQTLTEVLIFYCLYNCRNKIIASSTFPIICFQEMRLSSTVGVVIRLWARSPKILAQFHTRTRNLSLVQNICAGPGTHGATLSLGTGGLLPGSKAAGV
jgi:hypothetical protein